MNIFKYLFINGIQRGDVSNTRELGKKEYTTIPPIGWIEIYTPNLYR